MRHMILAIGLLLITAMPVMAQEDASGADQRPSGKAGRTVRGDQRETERAAALERGRERFFTQQSGFVGPDTVLPTVKLPDGFGVVPLNLPPRRK